MDLRDSHWGIWSDLYGHLRNTNLTDLNTAKVALCRAKKWKELDADLHLPSH
jgi:hypothetical protein